MRSRIILRDGESRLADHLRKNHWINCAQFRVGHGRKLGVVPLTHPHNLEFCAPALDLQPVVLCPTQVNLLPRQSFRYFKGLPRPYRHSPFLLDSSRQRHHYRDLEVCRCA